MSPSMFLFMTVIVIAFVQVQTEHNVKYTVTFINSDGSMATRNLEEKYNDTDVKRGDPLVKAKALSLINAKVPGYGFTPGRVTVCDVIRDGNGILSADIILNVPSYLGNVV